MLKLINKEISYLNKLGAKIEYIGETELGHKIPCCIIGDPCCKKILLIQAAIHAREWATGMIALKQAKMLLEKSFAKKCVVIIPFLNIDGIILATCGKLTNYKANARGVDLNVNFDARWGTGEKNIKYPSYENYIGIKPESEKETQALVKFTKKIKPTITLSYHARGREIYFDFFQSANHYKRDFEIAQKIAESTGYNILPSGNSAGGFKDWCITKLKIPAITLEMFPMIKYPLSEEVINKEWEILCNFLYEIEKFI